MSTEFRREARYTVFKGTDMAKLSEEGKRQIFLLLMRAGQIMEDAKLPMRKCLVIESDWPEYEPAWAFIEARVTGEPVADGFSAGDMADQGAKGFAAHDGEVEQLRAERDQLQADLTARDERIDQLESQLMPDLNSRPEERGTPETEPCSGCGTPGWTGACNKCVPY